MNDAVVGILGGVGGATITGALGYFSLRWKASGKVKATEADTLWAQSQDMRADLLKRIEQLEEKAEKQDKKIESLQDENLTLRERLLETRKAALELHDEVTNIKSNISGDVTALKQELSVLQGGNT